jgi:hypothetical protein
MPEPTIPEMLAECREIIASLREASTAHSPDSPLPWRRSGCESFTAANGDPAGKAYCIGDVEFIAAAVNALGPLLDVAEREMRKIEGFVFAEERGLGRLSMRLGQAEELLASLRQAAGRA